MPQDDSAPNKPVRVAIIGGGCAGMAAAWELSGRPGYVIDVYEKSWRLGGKGASVRDDQGRILEHGLHVWLGFYENAFRMMRECYGIVEANEWGPDAKTAEGRQRLTHGRFDEAFLPEPHVGVFDPQFFGDKVVWTGFFPPNESLPGTDFDDQDTPFSVVAYMTRAFDLAKTLMLSIVEPAPESGLGPGAPRPDGRSRADEFLNIDLDTPQSDGPGALLDRMAQLARTGALTSAAAMLQAMTMLEVWLRGLDLGDKAPDRALSIVEALASQSRKFLRDMVSVDPRLRMRTEIIDITLTVLTGLVVDGVMIAPDGLDSINNYDYREWLKRHGATREALESRFLRGAYDFAFAYEGGDLARPRMAAGVALRGAFRMFFTYRGALVWRMCSGMGDAIFAPLYAVLKTPGLRASPVNFHFLHELEALEFEAVREAASETGPQPRSSLVGVRFKQAVRKAPDDMALKDGCWPQRDDHLRAARPAEAGRRRTLRRGKDFDLAIVATGVGEFDEAWTRAGKPPDPATAERWTEMARRVKTVPTQAAQVWLNRSLEQLGWSRGSGIFTALGAPFDSYADMTHVLPAEAWAAGKDAPGPGSLAYFCSPLADSVVAGAKRNGKVVKSAIDAHVETNLHKLLAGRMQQFWPKLDRSKDIAHRHIQANYDGSERYTLSLPGSPAARISPLSTGIDNMTVAGDWTACGLDCGCVEAAVMSGRLAAAAICEDLTLNDIIGYDHP